MSGWWGWAWDYTSRFLPGNDEVVKDIIKWTIVALVGLALTWIGRRLLKWIKYLLTQKPDDSYWRVLRARSSVKRDGQGLWLTITKERPTTYDLRMAAHPRIVTVANHKGGVGKTTTTANLASAFARRLSKPVLAIDLDYQGTLSALMFAGTDWRPSWNKLSPASQAISDEVAKDNFGTSLRPFTWRDNRGRVVQTPNAAGIAAFYDLASTEDRVLIEWLVGDRRKDVRYALYDLLNSSLVRDRFSLVLIDAPPRTTIASVQALCASTHVLIPTILDNTSANAVGYFGTYLRTHESLWPGLRIAGILGTMSGSRTTIEPDALKTSGDALRSALDGATGHLRGVEKLGFDFEIPYQEAIPDIVAIARASASGIAYDCLGNDAEGREVRKHFDLLADELEKRLK